MIKSITLENFQSHEKTTIDFSDGVNAIIGLSDSGKTAILRALKWVITNKPSGEEFRSYWGGDTSVSIELDNGMKLTRGRTNSDNYYTLDIHGGLNNGHQEFRAFGQDVPEEIKKILNTSDINMAAQMDSPFLLSSNPGEVAQILNRIVNLDIIDRSISNIRKEKMEADRKVRQQEDLYADLNVQLEGFNYLEGMEKDVTVLGTLQLHRDKKIQTLSSLGTHVTEMRKIMLELKAHEKLLLAARKIDRLSLRIVELEDKKTTKHNLRVLATMIEKDLASLSTFKRYERSRKVVDKLLLSVENAERLCGTVDSLNTLTSDMRTATRKRDQWAREHKQLVEEFDKIFPDTCPLCGQGVTK